MATIRPPVDERIVGKMSIRHSFAAIAIFSGMIWATFFVMFRAVGEKDLTRVQQGIVLGVLGIWIVFCLCMAIVPPRKKLTPEGFLQLMKGKGVSLQQAGQVTADPYGGFPGSREACSFIAGDAAGMRAAGMGKIPDGAETIDRLGLVCVLFFGSAKRAAKARAQLSAMGDKLEKKDGNVVRLGFSADRIVIRHKNVLIYYNGRNRALRTALLSLETGKSSAGGHGLR